MIQAWQLFDGTTKVHAPKEARSSGTRKGQGPQWVDSCLSRQSVTFLAWQPAKLTRTAKFGQEQSFNNEGLKK